MPKLTIDNQAVEVDPGATILDAAERLGIHIPTLCYVRGMKPLESCFVCAVAVVGQKKLLPACATPAMEGMQVVTDSPEVIAARRTAVELLLSDHLGECLAPCELACPATWDIPGFMEALAAGDLAQAGAIARGGLVLPGVLGCICTAPCQKACRRNERDRTVAIADLHRFAADAPVAASAPPADAKQIAIVGSGPAGLAAAAEAIKRGCNATIFEAAATAGGSLAEIDPADLPTDVLAADIAAVEAMGATFMFETPIRDGSDLKRLTHDFDAVILAVGADAALDGFATAGVTIGDGHITIDKTTCATTLPSVFAAGACAGRKGLAVRIVADGMAAAASTVLYAAGSKDAPPPAPVVVRYGPLAEEEKDILWSRGTDAPAGPVTDNASAIEQAGRCLICGCRDNDRCRLRQVAAELGAGRARFVGERRSLDRDDSHPDVVFEPHKCILCGACVAKAQASGDKAALTFVGRGFAGRVSAPYEGTMAEALGEAAVEYADLCPTSAFHRKRS